MSVVAFHRPADPAHSFLTRRRRAEESTLSPTLLSTLQRLDPHQLQILELVVRGGARLEGRHITEAPVRWHQLTSQGWRDVVRVFGKEDMYVFEVTVAALARGAVAGGA